MSLIPDILFNRLIYKTNTINVQNKKKLSFKMSIM